MIEESVIIYLDTVLEGVRVVTLLVIETLGAGVDDDDLLSWCLSDRDLRTRVVGVAVKLRVMTLFSARDGHVTGLDLRELSHVTRLSQLSL